MCKVAILFMFNFVSGEHIFYSILHYGLLTIIKTIVMIVVIMISPKTYTLYETIFTPLMIFGLTGYSARLKLPMMRDFLKKTKRDN